jgi:hypothetical protein
MIFAARMNSGTASRMKLPDGEQDETPVKALNALLGRQGKVLSAHRQINQ